MSIQNSNLAKYGYDTVVAVTQKGLNSGIEKNYENSEAFSKVTFYYVKDDSGNPLQVQLADLKANYTNNIDPLSLSLSPAQQKALSTTKFYFAFSFVIGHFQDGSTDFVTLTPGSSTVKYFLSCIQLQIVFWNPDNSSWVNFKQSSKEDVNVYANINLTSVQNNSNLPPDVQAAVDTLGGTDLNIQQLIFDLDSDSVDLTSTLNGIENTGSVFKPLLQQFSKAYFSTYSTQSGALNYAITTANTASMVPSKMEWYVGGFVDGNGNVISNPTTDQQNLATLSYLFANNGDALPAGAQIAWNWLEDNGTSHNPDIDTNADVNKYDGAISIRRDAFANYLITNLNGYAQQNCWAAFIDQGDDPDTYGDLDFTTGSLPPYVFQPFNPNYVIAGDPDQLLVYFYDKVFNLPVLKSFSSSDTMKVTCCFELQVLLGDGYTKPINTLTLQQLFHVQIDAEITDSPYTTKQTLYSGSPVCKNFKDVFNIQLDDHGAIVFNKNTALSTSSDTSSDVNLPFDNDWDSTDDYIQSLAAKSFTEFPLTLPHQFVFPGGNAFTFQDAQFTAFSDLVCHFTYKAES